MSAGSTLDIQLSRFSVLFLAAAAVFIFIVRFLTLSPFLAGPESVNFALALRHYDLTAFTPHLPGYPIYLFLAKALRFLGFPDTYALILPGLASASLCVFPLFYIVRRLYGIQPANLAVILYALLPGLFLASEKPACTAVLLFPFFFSLRMLLRNLLLPAYLREHTRFFGLYAGAAGLGLLPGIQAETVVFFLPLILISVYGYFLLKRKKIMLETFNGVVAGFCLWAIPFFLSVSMGDLISAGTGVAAHAYVAPPDSSALPFITKTKLFLWNVFASGFLIDFKSDPFMAVPALLLLAVSLFFFVIGLKRVFKEWYLLLFILPYAGLVLVRGNLYDPSSTVLVQACLVVFMAVGIHRISSAYRKFTLMGLLILLFGSASLFRSLEYKNAKPPQEAVVEYLSQAARVDQAVIFCGPSVRLLKYRHPEFTSFGVKSVKEMDRLMETVPGREVYATSEVEGVPGIGGRFQEAARFSGPEYLYGKGNGIVLYRLSPQTPAP